MCAPCMDCRAKAKKYILVAGAYLVAIDISQETRSEGQHIILVEYLGSDF